MNTPSASPYAGRLVKGLLAIILLSGIVAGQTACSPRTGYYLSGKGSSFYSDTDTAFGVKQLLLFVPVTDLNKKQWNRWARRVTEGFERQHTPVHFFTYKGALNDSIAQALADTVARYNIDFIVRVNMQNTYTEYRNSDMNTGLNYGFSGFSHLRSQYSGYRVKGRKYSMAWKCNCEDFISASTRYETQRIADCLVQYMVKDGLVAE